MVGRFELVGARASSLKLWPGCSRPTKSDLLSMSEKALKKADYAGLNDLAQKLGIPQAAGPHEEEDLRRRVLQCRIN